jgi:hypothetical protein
LFVALTLPWREPAPSTPVNVSMGGRRVEREDYVRNRADRPESAPAAELAGRAEVSGQGQQGQQGISAVPPAASGPVVIRTATITLSTDRFDPMREAIERLTADHGGRIGHLEQGGTAPSPRTLRATLRIPSARLDAALAALRALGRVTRESLSSEEVTDGYRDLRARIANSRREEQRLVELLGRRTGDLADVLQVEQALARVRGEIERMEAQFRSLQDRVDLATIRVDIDEAYKANLTSGAPPLTERFQNAVVDGAREALASLVTVALTLLRFAPVVIVWTLLLFWPLRRLWRASARARL